MNTKNDRSSSSKDEKRTSGSKSTGTKKTTGNDQKRGSSK
jgi:hypothetical protein